MTEREMVMAWLSERVVAAVPVQDPLPTWREKHGYDRGVVITFSAPALSRTIETLPGLGEIHVSRLVRLAAYRVVHRCLDTEDRLDICHAVWAKLTGYEPSEVMIWGDEQMSVNAIVRGIATGLHEAWMHERLSQEVLES